MAPANLLAGLPTTAPEPSKTAVRFADVAVTATGAEFQGVYRGKQYHPPDFEQVLERAHTANVQRILLTGMSLHDVDVNLSIATRNPAQCGITVGVHPYHAAEPENDPAYFGKLTSTVNELLQKQPRLIRAFGELGLDYDRLDRADKDIQIRTFASQLEMVVSNDWDLPLFLHCRAAFDDFIGVIGPYIPKLRRSGLVHSFVGTSEQMHHLVKLGFDISVNGFSFRDLDSLRMVGEIPLRRLQIETDAPWGEVKDNDEVWGRFGVNYAGKEGKRKKKDKWEAGCMVKDRNESCCIERVAFVVAGCMGQSVEKVTDAAWQNSIDMFWPDEMERQA